MTKMSNWRKLKSCYADAIIFHDHPNQASPETTFDESDQAGQVGFAGLGRNDHERKDRGLRGWTAGDSAL